ncbi:hypothetical protein KTH81_09710 [Lachnospiraceae bacterium ASD3451]|nr:hypothetical protein [Diplocloster agilis]
MIYLSEIDTCRESVEAVKITVNALQYTGISIKNTLSESIYQLNRWYEQRKDSTYLEAALIQIRAYMELGFDYKDNYQLFDSILKKLGTCREMIFPKKFYNAKKINLNPNSVRSMIRTWSCSPYHTMPIKEVVDDIIEKVKSHKNGIYTYCRNNRPGVGDNNDMYLLVINDQDCYFHDVKKNKFYEFNI